MPNYSYNSLAYTAQIRTKAFYKAIIETILMFVGVVVIFTLLPYISPYIRGTNLAEVVVFVLLILLIFAFALAINDWAGIIGYVNAWDGLEFDRKILKRAKAGDAQVL